MTSTGSQKPQAHFHCPTCQARQHRGEQCVNCGLIFEKYFQREEEREAGIIPGAANDSKAAAPSNKAGTVLLSLLLVTVLAVIVWQTRTVDSGESTSDTLSENVDPNLAAPFIPYPRTATIRHDTTFMEWPRFDGPTRLDNMSLGQVADYRKDQVARHAYLGFFHPGYDPLKPPHDALYGHITPLKPWLTPVAYYVANPYLLLSLTHNNKVAPFTFFLESFELVYSAGKITEVHTGDNGTAWKEFLQGDPQRSNIVEVVMVNAWDAGFYHVHLVERQSENIVPSTVASNIGTSLYSQRSQYRADANGKHNIGPYDIRGCITIKDSTAPTRLVFHLWRKKPPTTEVKPDLVYEMRMVPEHEE